MTKGISGWVRNKSEERDGDVYRWFYNAKRGGYASVVQSDIPSQVEVRVSYNKFDKRFTIPGSKSIILNQSDEKLIKTIEMHIKRHEDR